MKKFSENKWFSNILVILILIINFILIISSSWEKSAIYDEAVNISSGYIHWKTGNSHVNREHLTSWKLFVTAPLLFLKLKTPNNLDINQYEIGDKFLYNNNVSADTILHVTRITNAIGAIILGFFIYKWAFILWGYYGAILSLILYVLSPNMSAWAGVVNTDFGLTVLVFLSVFMFWLYLRNPSTKKLFLTGILFGLAQSTKVSALLLYPLFLFLGIFWIKYRKEKTFPMILISIIKIFIIGFFVLSITYIFSGLPNYFAGVNQIFNSMKEGRDVFINGNIYRYGVWYYYLFALMIKNPVPFLILLFWVVSYVYSLKKDPNLKIVIIFLSVVPIVWLMIASLSKSQLGIRYILPIYPFIFVLLGIISKSLNNPKKYILAFLIIWMVINNVKIYPHYLTFFNEFIGGSKNGYKYLTNDLDAGQDLKNLAKYLKPGDEIILSYCGCARPEYYGVNPQYRGIISEVLFKTEKMNSLTPKRELLCVSALFLQTATTKEGLVYAWLKEYKPIEIIGNSILVYDITIDTDAHKNLAYAYEKAIDYDAAKREWDRILVIDNKNEESYMGLAGIYITRKEYDKAIKECNLALRNSPDSYMANNMLGQIYGIKGELEKSRFYLERSVQINPNFAGGHYDLAVTYERLKEKTLLQRELAILTKLGYFNK
ncbi:MAG: glycosyltransferase family 39 protein [Elusimicrobia bacterium]|nr:glycosyltransferase family 39 protein [Elusimicrobiota bacterium]